MPATEMLATSAQIKPNTMAQPGKSLNFIANTKDLRKVVGLVGKIVERKNIMPILQNIKLETLIEEIDGQAISYLKITATDLDTAVSEKIAVEIISEGATTLPNDLFAKIISKVSDETINVIVTGDSAEIKGKSFSFNVPVIDPKDYPTLDIQENDVILSYPIKGDELLRIIEKTIFSVSREETRYNLMGIFFNIKPLENGSILSAASTDGHRLSTSATRLSKGNLPEVGIIIPKKTAGELLAILKEEKVANSEVFVQVSSSKVKFNIGTSTIVSKLIDGSFPDYNSFIPEHSANILEVEATRFADAIDRISLITSEKFRAITIAISKDKIVISAIGESNGKAEEIIENMGDEKIVSYEGEDLVIGFNPKYVQDILSAIDDKYVTIKLNDSFSPVLIKEEADSLSSFVVMPIKVSH